ncbi:MAG: peptide deformylase [SAR324 cluster bacterium]|nr:peptide deformylase [SAR324 cluster bacterium]
MAILEIYTFPDQILRKKAETVTVFDRELERTVQSMLETMYVSSGIGLAAIQAGILKQIIVIDLKSGEEDKSLREPNVFINPKIVTQSGTTVSEEGCLSVIDFRGEIQRAEKITVEYQDVTGEIQKMEAEEMMSICLQHEIDHLNGVLFIDHLPLLKQKMVKKRLKKLAKVEA